MYRWSGISINDKKTILLTLNKNGQEVRGDLLKMKTVEFIGNFIKKIKNTLSEIVLVNNSVINDVVLINMKRIFYISIVAMPVNLAHILIFAMKLSLGNETEIKWRMGIIICHSILLFIMGILGCLSFFLSKKEKSNLLMRLIQNTAMVIILVFGAIVVSIDQLVTPNITPFLVACTITGLVLLIRPFVIIIAYLCTFIAFYYATGLAQMDQAILLSNRVNGITAIAIGIYLSITLWKTNVSNILQRRFIVNQQRELAEKNRELEYLAFYDPMTSLYNRRRFEELLKNEISMIRRYGHESCISILDVDHFKEINDNYGHPFGDMVIKQIASILKENIRETDAVSRWGGEEFLILLPHTSLSDGRIVAEKLRQIIEDKILLIKEREIQITASLGVAKLRGDNNDSLELAYKDADEALYMAKESGRNCVKTA